MSVHESGQLPSRRRPGGAPGPIGGIALGVALAGVALWLDGPASAVKVFIAVLALLNAFYRSRRDA